MGFNSGFKGLIVVVEQGDMLQERWPARRASEAAVQEVIH